MSIPSCYKKKDLFCYICAKYIIKNKKQQFKGQKLELYRMYFGFYPINLGSNYAPSYICSTCSTCLYTFKKGRNFSFGRPAFWRQVDKHPKDCFFCLTNTFGLNSLTKKSVNYPICLSCELPVPHSDDCPRPIAYSEQIKSEQREKELLSILTYQCSDLTNKSIEKNLEVNEEFIEDNEEESNKHRNKKKPNKDKNDEELNKFKGFDLNNKNLTSEFSNMIDQSDDLEMINESGVIEMMNQSGDLVADSIIKELIANEEPNSSFNLTIDNLLANSTQEIVESESEFDKKEELIDSLPNLPDL